MASLVSGSSIGDDSSHNFRVDFVIRYSLASENKKETEIQFERLIKALDHVGLAVQVRYADQSSIFIFVKVAADVCLMRSIYRSRLTDWLHDDGNSEPPKNMFKNFEEKPIKEAERLRFVYTKITNPLVNGGAAINPRSDNWKYVESIFPLHDYSSNKIWVKKLSSKYFLDEEDYTEIKNQFGERIAFYFAFLRSYFLFLSLPAGIGFSAWAILGQYSPTYAIFNALWCIIFLEYWKEKEKQLANQWGMDGRLKSRRFRPEFKHEIAVHDQLTEYTLYNYSPIKRLLSQLLLVPFAIAASITLGGLIVACFAIEVFLSEIYDGPFKTYLVFLPTIILSTIMPAISALLTSFASKLTDLENYETIEAHETSMIRKIFILNFIISYVPIFLTAFVYVPFAQVLVPYINVFYFFLRSFTKTEKQMAHPNLDFHINQDRLTKQVIYFTVTAQIVNFGLEVIYPYVRRVASSKFKQVKANKAAKNSNRDATSLDNPMESAFLARVRYEADLATYDITTDFREMVVQFGYLSLFSAVWPLTALSFLINNWVEIYGDVIKLTMETQRPVPWQADSIGPWIDALGFLSWLGSLTSAALVYLFSGDGLGPDGTPWKIKAWGLFLTMFLSEHIYRATQIIVRLILSRIGDSERQKERTERLKIRLDYVYDRLLWDEQEGEFDEINTLEDKSAVENCFWQHRHDLSKTIYIWKRYISDSSSSESKKKNLNLLDCKIEIKHVAIR